MHNPRHRKYHFPQKTQAETERSNGHKSDDRASILQELKKLEPLSPEEIAAATDRFVEDFRRRHRLDDK